MAEANRRVLDDLPAIVGVEAQQVKYDPPRYSYVGTEARPISRGVELLVRTTAALPVLAIAPVLFIGETIIGDYEIAGENLYRFFVFDLDRVKLGAPIAIGWPFAPKATRLTDFRFQIPGNVS